MLLRINQRVGTRLLCFSIECSLFNDAVCISDHKASDGRLISELKTVRKEMVLVGFRISRYFPGGTEKTKINLSQNTCFNLNLTFAHSQFRLN